MGNLNMAEIGHINRKKNKKAACPLGVPLKKEKVKSAMLQISLPLYIIVKKMKEMAILNGQKNNQRHHLQKCNKVRLWLRMVEQPQPKSNFQGKVRNQFLLECQARRLVIFRL